MLEMLRKISNPVVVGRGPAAAAANELQQSSRNRTLNFGLVSKSRIEVLDEGLMRKTVSALTSFCIKRDVGSSDRHGRLNGRIWNCDLARDSPRDRDPRAAGLRQSSSAPKRKCTQHCRR